MREPAGVTIPAVRIIVASYKPSTELEGMFRKRFYLFQQQVILVDDNRNPVIAGVAGWFQALDECQMQAILLLCETFRTHRVLPGSVESTKLAHCSLGPSSRHLQVHVLQRTDTLKRNQLWLLLCCNRIHVFHLNVEYPLNPPVVNQ